MRLSRPRVLIRAVLLLVGGGFMLVKALAARRAAGAVALPADAALLERIALVEALVGALALAAAGMALLALRRRKRTRTLQLKDVERP